MIEGDALVLNAPDGVSDQQAQARRDRADARRAERDRRRAAERELRKERDAQRDAARQEERRRLLREKKARKQAEREARARAAGAIIPTRRTAKTRRNAAPVPVPRAAPVKPQARVAAAAPVVQPRAPRRGPAPPIPPKKKGPPPMKKAITVPQEVLEGEFYWQHTDGEQRGPSTWPEYKQAHASGETNAELLVYCADVADEWKAAQEVPNLMAYVEAPDAPAPKPPKPPPVPRMLAVPSARAKNRSRSLPASSRPGTATRTRSWPRRRRLSPSRSPRGCRGPLRSVRSDRQHAGARRGVGARAPGGARRGPVRSRCPVPSTPSRRVASMASGPRTHPHTGFTTQGAGDEAQVQEARGPGDGEAGTFKIDIMAAVFGSLQVRQAQGRPYWAGPQVPPC